MQPLLKDVTDLLVEQLRDRAIGERLAGVALSVAPRQPRQMFTYAVIAIEQRPWRLLIAYKKVRDVPGLVV